MESSQPGKGDLVPRGQARKAAQNSNREQTGEVLVFATRSCLSHTENWTLPADRVPLPCPSSWWQGDRTLPGSIKPHLPDPPPTSAACLGLGKICQIPISRQAERGQAGGCIQGLCSWIMNSFPKLVLTSLGKNLAPEDSR